ncbi:MAG: hypothetical protein HC782_04840 [Gammaproteobacteria bacterium]|nr:hypothetical protein [Gammaproteobacteria bacterium]
MLFAPSELYWEKDKKTTKNQVVTNLLPIQWDTQINAQAEMSVGGSMELREELFIAPPISWLEWHDDSSVKELRTNDLNVAKAADVKVLDPNGASCQPSETGFLWPAEQPREVSIRWKMGDQSIKARIPVIDKYGRIAATTLAAINIDAAWWQLADFPIPPEDDGDDSDDDANNIKQQY